MTQERNAPCKCGSGKKYKKCCYLVLAQKIINRLEGQEMPTSAPGRRPKGAEPYRPPKQRDRISYDEVRL